MWSWVYMLIHYSSTAIFMISFKVGGDYLLYLERNHNHCSIKITIICISLFSTGGVPPDGTPVVIVTTVFLPLSIVYFVAVAIGITFAIVCLLFNFFFRNRKWVLLSNLKVMTYALHCHHATIESSAWLAQISITSSLLVPCYFMHLLFFTSSPQLMSSLLHYFARWDSCMWINIFMCTV